MKVTIFNNYETAVWQGELSSIPRVGEIVSGRTFHGTVAKIVHSVEENCIDILIV